MVKMVDMESTAAAVSFRKRSILDAAIVIFGRFGFRRTSVDDLAQGAKISKQGLYLHFPSKDAVFIAAMEKYLDDGLRLVDQALGETDLALGKRLEKAMDAWFGRHIATFGPASFDVIEAGDRLSKQRVEEYISSFQSKLRIALAGSPEFRRSGNICTAKEISQVLFQCGLTWKEGFSRDLFRKSMARCIRACCQVES